MNVRYYYNHWLYSLSSDSRPILPTLQNPSLPSRLIPPVPSFSVLSSSPSLDLYWWVGTCRSQSCAGSNFNWRRPSVSKLPPRSPAHSGKAGAALGKAALSWCEDDVLCEMVEVTLLMREINCSNQSRNLREEMTEAHEYMVLTKALPEISLSWKIELWLLQRAGMIASVMMLRELYKEQPKQFQH